jgi:hypothetical protein
MRTAADDFAIRIMIASRVVELEFLAKQATTFFSAMRRETNLPPARIAAEMEKILDAHRDSDGAKMFVGDRGLKNNPH